MAGIATVNRQGRDMLKARERQIKALEMKRGGATYEQIVATLKFSDSGAVHHAIERALKRTEEAEVKLYRALEGDRLDRMWAALWPDVLQRDDPERRNQAIDRCLKIVAQRRRIFGLDAPIKVDIRPYVEQMASAANVDATLLLFEVEAYLREIRV